MFVQQQGLKLPARLPATSRIFIAKRKTKKSKGIYNGVRLELTARRTA
jgi:hypothetical protein